MNHCLLESNRSMKKSAVTPRSPPRKSTSENDSRNEGAIGAESESEPHFPSDPDLASAGRSEEKAQSLTKAAATKSESAAAGGAESSRRKSEGEETTSHQHEEVGKSTLRKGHT